MKTIKALCATMLLSPVISYADGVQGNGLTYDHVGIGYANIRADAKYLGTSYLSTFTGISLEGSKLLNENIFIQGSYFDTSTDKIRVAGTDVNVDMDFKQYQISAGYRHPLELGTDFIATIGVIHNWTRLVKNNSIADTSYPISIGVRKLLASQVEGGIEGIAIDGDFGYMLSLQYKISDIYAVGGMIRHDKDRDVYTLTARFLF